MNVKKLIISILCVVALFLPTYLAIASYAINRDAPVSAKGIDRMEIADPQGSVFKIAASEDGNDIVALFSEMNENSVPRSELPAQLVGHNFYKVTFHTGKKTVDYKYYFSADAEQCYYVDELGAVHQIRSEQAAKFVSTPYALALYAESVAPVLRTMSGEAIMPASIAWNYRAANGSFINRGGLDTVSGVSAYTMDGGISFDFTIPPDSVAVKVYDGATMIFDGSYDQLSAIDIRESKKFTFELNANWYEDSTRNYHGNASYRFEADVVAPAEFYLGTSGPIEPGEFVVLSGINVADISKISFSSEPSINYTPTFFADGKYVHALIPISYDLDYSPSYTFTVSYGITKQTINLSVKEKTFGTHNYDISATLVTAHRNENALNTFDKLAAELCKTADSTRYFEGRFIDYDTDLKWTIVTGIGRFRTILATKQTYRHAGVDFYTHAGTDVPAVNNGRVIYTGTTDLSGKMVVVEHGYGLKSWYAHLSEISVSVGDTVTTGQAVGKTGSTGFTAFSGTHLGMTVYDVPVSPYPLWESGVEMYFNK
ncbi:MAG: M23 family metallopeptidase [Clostridia bacterium]|nr:M23 family metallopeptidase [Clostridia bacterium]